MASRTQRGEGLLPRDANLLLFVFMALGIAKTKEILKRPDMSDEEAEKIQSEFRALAEIIFEKWSEERKNTHYQITKKKDENKS